VFHGWDVYRSESNEEQIRREIDKMR